MQVRVKIYLLAILMLGMAGGTGSAVEKTEEALKKAIFAGGCFWCMQPVYDKLPGVVSTRVGYTGGRREDPTYEEVSTGTTGHVEAIEIVYNPSKISYPKLLETFWRTIDPTNDHGQFSDLGSQYLTAVFYHDDKQKRLALESKEKLAGSGLFDRPIVTEVRPAAPFYAAEEHHQKYYLKSANHYNLYKTGSGREGFLKRVWSDKGK